MSGLTGAQKAATLLLQLGRERAARVMAELEVSEVEELTAEILRLNHIDQRLADEVLEEFYAFSAVGPGLGGGAGMAQHLLEATIGAEQAAGMMERLRTHLAGDPFEFMRVADARQVVSLLSGEHPQTIALVLAHLRPEQASAIMAGLPPQEQADTAHRIALMERATPDAVQIVADSLQRKASAVLAPRETTAVGGVQPLVDIINRADPTTEKLILEGLKELDEPLADEVRSMMFVFTDVVVLEDRAVQLVLRNVETGELALAMKGAPPEVSDMILRNLSERARDNLVEEIDLLGPVRLSQVEEARAHIVQGIRRLEESGQITIRRDSDDELVV
ncbi:MAG: flagellar motor switch protein FliG [Micrococcales bacterium]|nr:flagellar motor switch protein FliG [Micrococcales bacterium]